MITTTPRCRGRGKKLSKPITQKQFEENLINSIKNPYILKKGKKEIKEIKDRISRDIRTVFEEEEYYYKPKRVRTFWKNDYIEFKSNGDREKKLKKKLEEYLKKIKPHLRDIIIDLQESDT